MKNFLCVIALSFLAGCMNNKTSVENDFQKIIRNASNKVFPSLVFIQAVTENGQYGKEMNQVVQGSGVIISSEGEFLTNFHVIDKALEIRCLLDNGENYYADVIGSDKELDLALLKLNAPKGKTFNYVNLCKDEGINAGDFVMAMGAPWGMNRSVSMGIISCSNRYLPNSLYSLWYQTDASISPGNSGGPLVNTSGDVIGINTLGVLYGGNLGFTIPSNTISDILPRFREYGNANWAWLGLELQPLKNFSQNIYFNFSDGVIVSGTLSNSPARNAGFLPNDRILSLNGKPITIKNKEDMPNFQRLLGMLRFKESVCFEVERKESTGTIKKLIEVKPIAKGKIEGDELICKRWGLTAKNINRFDTPTIYFYKNEGLYIYGVAYPGNAASCDFQRNDIIESINGVPVKNLDELKEIYDQAIDNIDRNSEVSFIILRNGRQLQKVLDFYKIYENEE